MKKILMPKEGVLFQKDNSYRLDYKFQDEFVETRLWSAKGTPYDRLFLRYDFTY